MQTREKYNRTLKKKYIEKKKEIYKDKNTVNIRINSGYKGRNHCELL